MNTCYLFDKTKVARPFPEALAYIVQGMFDLANGGFGHANGDVDQDKICSNW